KCREIIVLMHRILKAINLVEFANGCCAGCSNAQGKALDAVKQPYVKRSVCRVGNSSTGQCFTNNSRGITTTYVIGLADLATGAAIVKSVRHGGVPGYMRCCSSK